MLGYKRDTNWAGLVLRTGPALESGMLVDPAPVFQKPVFRFELEAGSAEQVVDGTGGGVLVPGRHNKYEPGGFIREGTLFTSNVANITFLDPGIRFRSSSQSRSRRETSGDDKLLLNCC